MNRRRLLATAGVAAAALGAAGLPILDTARTASGYQEVPLGEGDINFQQFFQTIGLPDHHHANYEMDDAQLGGSTDPGKSLRIAQQSYATMAGLTLYI